MCFLFKLTLNLMSGTSLKQPPDRGGTILSTLDAERFLIHDFLMIFFFFFKQIEI